MVTDYPNRNLKMLAARLRLQRLLVGKIHRESCLGVSEVVVTHFRPSIIVQEVETDPRAQLAIGPDPGSIDRVIFSSPIHFRGVLEEKSLVGVSGDIDGKVIPSRRTTVLW